MGRPSTWPFAIVTLAFALLSPWTLPSAEAAPKAKPQAAAKKGKKAADKEKAEEAAAGKEKAEAETAEAEATDRKPDASQEDKVKAAGTAASTKDAKADVKEVKEEKEEGVKTYKFGTIEIEGRLKSPQIIYFLRRVRAEFEAGALGHRSFMRELSDTRRSPSFR